MRRILLWMARNRWLKEHLPRLWFARRAVRRFMPGETIEAALDAAEEFRPLGIGILLTHLGENLADLAQAQEVADHYHRVIDLVRARGMDAEVSLKLTQIGLDLDADATYGHLASLAAQVKDHGEGGDIVGSPLAGRVLIIDDVISAGTSIRESVHIIRSHGAVPAGVVIALDRQEVGRNRRSAVQEIGDEFGIPVASIVSLDHLIAYLAERPDTATMLERIRAYREIYGVRPAEPN